MPKAEISFEIVEHICVLSTGSKGWTKELNLISWNGRAPKYDLRECKKCKIDFMNKELGTKPGLFVFKYA